tara:strand:+ start:155 stop:745 length:591 start_codon:yes stop_codon:yes gene_type:complete
MKIHNMLNVLSIDLDYAYSPTISKYDDYVEGCRITLEEQESIFKKHSLPNPKPNQDKITYLKNVFLKKSKKTAPVYLINNHHEILRHLPKKQKFCIYNFDHHHDVFYPGWHDLEELDEGNWVSHLQNYPIEKFVWIKNKDSENREDKVKLNFVWEEILLPEEKELPNFDIVIGCVSPPWTGRDSKIELNKILEEKK